MTFLEKMLISICCCLHFHCLALDVTVGPLSSGADFETDGTSDQFEIQAAIDTVSMNGGGMVQLLAGSYQLSARVQPKSNVTLKGNSMATTTLTGNFTFDYLLFNASNAISNFHLSDLSIDPQNAANASGIRLEAVTNVSIKRVSFVNVTCDGWHLVVGVPDAAAASGGTVRSQDVLIEDCIFDGHQGSLEMLLLYNLTNVVVNNCTFQNKTTGCPVDGNRPILGLWQFTTDACITNCTFINNQSVEAFYYSNTCINTLVQGCTFDNTGALRGSNISDNGPFHGNPAEGLAIRDCNFMGGTNDIDGPAITIGAVNGVLIENCMIDEYVVGISFHDGYNISHIAKHVAVVNTTIRNCNNTGSLHGIHPGVLYEGTSIGVVRHFYICGTVLDTALYPDGHMIHSFSFIGGGTIDSIYIKGMHLQEDPIGQEFHFENSTMMGTNMTNEQCDGTAGQPAYCVDCTASGISRQAVQNLIQPLSSESATRIDALYDLGCNLSALPLEMGSFKGYQNPNAILLKWNTFSETASSHFEIEKQTITSHFKKIGEIAAHGYSTTEQHYQLQDSKPDKGINYYRLKMLDLDGSYAYSKVIAVEWTKEAMVYIHPIPTRDILSINLSIDVPYSITISSIKQVLFKKENIAHTPFHLDLSAFPKGVYFMEIRYGNQQLIRKIVKI